MVIQSGMADFVLLQVIRTHRFIANITNDSCHLRMRHLVRIVAMRQQLVLHIELQSTYVAFVVTQFMRLLFVRSQTGVRFEYLHAFVARQCGHSRVHGSMRLERLFVAELTATLVALETLFVLLHVCHFCLAIDEHQATVGACTILTSASDRMVTQ